MKIVPKLLDASFLCIYDLNFLCEQSFVDAVSEKNEP